MLVSDSDSTTPNKGADEDIDSRNVTNSSGLHNISLEFFLTARFFRFSCFQPNFFGGKPKIGKNKKV